MAFLRISPSTPPELATDIVSTLAQRPVLPGRWGSCDDGAGQNPACLAAIAARGLFYVAEVPHAPRVGLARPPTAVPARSNRGPAPTHARRRADAPAPVRVDRLAAQGQPAPWQRWQIKEGANGPLGAEFALVRGGPVRAELPGAESWLGRRRRLGAQAELQTDLCNAPVTTAQRKLGWARGLRGLVESAIKASNEEVGLDQYAVRGWGGGTIT